MPDDGGFSTEQEAFWAGAFGDEYTERNRAERLRAATIALFARILSRTRSVETVIEFGANIGLNLLAIRTLLPGVRCSAVEINRKVAAALRAITGVTVFRSSIFDHQPDSTCDLALSKGLLIHIAPTRLSDAYAAWFVMQNGPA